MNEIDDWLSPQAADAAQDIFLRWYREKMARAPEQANPVPAKGFLSERRRSSRAEAGK